MTERGAPARARVGLLATHPVQYYVPWYRELARVLDLEVFFAHRQTAEGQGRAGFGVAFEWDVPLLDGYAHRFLENRARRPDVSTFFGCRTPEIASIVARARFDAFIVHGWANQSYWQAITACWRSRTPVMIRGDSQLAATRPAPLRLAKWPVYRAFVPRFDAYLVVGERARAYYAHYGADASRMFPAPHGVDNERFRSAALARRGARGRLCSRFGVPADAAVFLFAGKLIAEKRPADFVRAVAEAERRGSRVWGLVAGDGPQRAELASIVAASGVPVRFAGFLNQGEMPDAYAACDALVLPSASESWGLVVNEAMASGRPALVSDRAGCAPDLVRDGETGFAFRCGDVGQLADLLQRVAGDASLAERMGHGAERRVQAYSPGAAARGTVLAVESVAERRGPIASGRRAAGG